MKSNSIPPTVQPLILDQSSLWSRWSQSRKVFSDIVKKGDFVSSGEWNPDTDPLFSVMLITFNHGNYIAQALDSILNQHRDFDIEINVIDDASTDDTQAVVLEYQKKYPKVIKCYFNEVNVGNKVTQINTFRGFQTLRGKYFSLLEGDDYWTSQSKLKQQIDTLENDHSLVACAHYTEKIFDDGRPSEHFLPFKEFGRDKADFHHVTHMHAVYHLSSIVYRNSFGPNPPQCLADPFSCEVTINMVYAQFGDFFCINDYMSAYRVHDGGAFSTRSEENIWLFHIHGFRHFFLYLGPRFYYECASSIVKLSKYVLQTRSDPEFGSLKSSTTIIFISHLVLFAPIKMISIAFKLLEDLVSKPYIAISELLPLAVQEFVFKYEVFIPPLKRTRLRLKSIAIAKQAQAKEQESVQ